MVPLIIGPCKLFIENSMRGCLADGHKTDGRNVYIFGGKYEDAGFKYIYGEYKLNSIVKYRLQG